MTAVAPVRRDRPPPPAWGKGGVLLLVVLGGAAILLACGDALPPWCQPLLWGSLVAVPAVALAWAWCRRLGPLLPCELLRCGRRDRYVFFRCLYACVLLGVLGWSYLNWFAARGAAPAVLLWEEGNTLAADDLPRFAGEFFTAFLSAQLAVVLLLTPVYVAGAIAEERERRTLEFLLATDLGPAEIVVSKLSARLLNLALLLLTGLPVLALTQLWGGVDPFRVAAGFAATGLTMLSVGSLSIWNSVAVRRPVEAVLRTYGQLAISLIVCCLPGLAFGHPVMLVSALAGANDASMLLTVAGYALVHVLATYLLVHTACTRLRLLPFLPPDTLEPELVPTVAPGHPAALTASVRPHPRVADEAVLWKELHVEPHWTWDKQHPLVGLFFLFVGVCVGSLGITLVLVLLTDPLGGYEPMNVWVRSVGTTLAGLLLFATSFYAAGAISRERERQTLDSLLTLPDGRSAILAAKWRGSFLSTRGLWWCLGAVWGLGVVTGALHLLMVPLLVAGFASAVAFVTSLGLFCSTVCRSTLRATLATVVTLLAVSGGAGLLGWGGVLAGSLSPEVAWWAVAFLQDGLALPAPLWALAVRYDELGHTGGQADWVAAAVAGLVVYALAAWVLWRLALARFEAEAGPPPRKQQV
jgi:ABC-type transport system involved in multi-copper enzyme maturation permease subunit